MAKITTLGPIIDGSIFNVFEETYYFTTSNHLLSEILQANDKALSQLEYFNNLIQAAKDKVSKDCKSKVTLRIPEEKEHQFSAILSILEDIFKWEMGDGVKFQITAKIN